MLSGVTIIGVAFLYLCILFAIAYYGDKRADQGRSLIANPYIYALSIAVYCTSWTFYGSAGRAVSTGVGFLPIYIGPTLTFILGWYLIRKIIRISKVNRITSIADFIASRYGKSAYLGGLVTVIAVVGVLPYISLQLKAITISFGVLVQYPAVTMPIQSGAVPFMQDTALFVALIMAAFAILFGTRHIDASEHHEGMVAAVAFESVIKLLAFLVGGIAVTYWIYGGFGDIFARAAASPELARLFTIDTSRGAMTSWIALTVLAMGAVLVLPRQFQVIVVENVDERHVRKAIWLFPLYLLLINIFVLPIAIAGILHFPKGAVDADTFVLTVAMAERYQAIALLVFLGGLSAATGMIIVETIALSTMVCNDLVMPLLLRFAGARLAKRRDLTGLLLAIRRGAIVVVILLGYGYVRLIGESYALVTIGLVSFVAAMQFVPAIVGGVLWKGATRHGAIAGLTAGFIVWLYTLLLPSLARSGWLSETFITDGLFGIALLKPYALFGLTDLDAISHATFWTLVVNLGLYIGVSLVTTQSIIERSQANQFVDIFNRAQRGERIWRGRATIADLRGLLLRFIGEERADAAFRRFERTHDRRLPDNQPADAEIVAYCERQLAGAIGASSARIMVASVLREEMHDIDGVMQILDEASQLVVYSRRLETKSRELEAATDELRAANERLKELDKLKDDFVSTVSHELRTPLTSIRSFSEIVQDNPELDVEQRNQFLRIVVSESERLTRLINDILDLAKMEAGQGDWVMVELAPGVIIEQAIAATSSLFARDNVALEVDIAADLPTVFADADRLTQVVVNLLANAVKFRDSAQGHVGLTARIEKGWLRVDVSDNGPGIPEQDRERIFERFQQAGNTLTSKPTGTGLGLPISRQIVRYFGGDVWVASKPGEGTRFSFNIPPAAASPARRHTPTAQATAHAINQTTPV
jgi:Na+/proline symporter/nitrogen-specific signal transduction histidine kinase